MASSHPVEAHRVVVEKRPPLAIGEIASDVIERAPDGVEAGAQAVDRVIAGEQGALGAELLDEGEGDFTPRRRIEVPEPGDLHRYVAASGEPAHGGAPRRAIGRRRQTGMVD